MSARLGLVQRDINQNARWRAYRQKLADNGITLDPFATVNGPHVFGFILSGALAPDAPKTMLVQDLGEAGFTTYFESPHVKTADEIAMLTGRTPS